MGRGVLDWGARPAQWPSDTWQELGCPSSVPLSCSEHSWHSPALPRTFPVWVSVPLAACDSPGVFVTGRGRRRQLWNMGSFGMLVFWDQFPKLGLLWGCLLRGHCVKMKGGLQRGFALCVSSQLW